MTDIFVDPSVTSMPDAADHLGHLIDTGHRLVLVGDVPSAVLDGLPGADQVATLPDRVSAGSWRVSADAAICSERVAGLQTLLVGPRVTPAPRVGARCDAEARDLSSAVLEILGRDVMG
jgi:hypothetical protein